MSDNYSETTFDITEEDEIIYSPYGFFGKRYIVPSLERWQKMTDWNRRSGFLYTIFVMLAQIAIERIFHPLDIESELESKIHLGIFVLITIIYFSRWYQINKKFVAGLKQTTVKNSLQDVVKRKSQSFSFLDIFMIEFVLLFILVIAAYTGYLYPKGPYIGNPPTESMQIFMIFLFVLGLIVFFCFLYLLIIKIRSRMRD